MDVALTFDDGPGPSTERLLDVLARHGARATFFVLGRNLQGEALAGDGARARGLVTRAARDGHLLGNHTMSHLPELAPEELLAEVAACDELLRECYRQAGRPSPEIPVRLPFGPYRPDGPRAVAALEGAGRPHCHWTGDPQDWRPGVTAAEIVAAVLAHAEKAWQHQRTPIVLLHDAGPGAVENGVVREATVDAVDQICAALVARQARTLTLPECDPRRYRLPPARAARPA
jgi:peptidoglycan/xylan/chitin deacetylase (PgdA/CDA1 family)